MKKSVVLVLALCMLLISGLPALAAEGGATSGFYDVGTAQNVVITAYKDDVAVDSTMKNLDNDEEMEQLYDGSNRLEVSYTDATYGEYYGVILVTGNGLPTKDSEIIYIDQVTAKSDTVNFNVYPMLPDKATPLSLYISSSAEDFELAEVALNYYLPGAAYVLGDINADGEYDVKDALIALQIGIGKFDTDENIDTLKAAADVNLDGECDVKDALLILQRGIGKIESFN